MRKKLPSQSSPDSLIAFEGWLDISAKSPFVRIYCPQKTSDGSYICTYECDLFPARPMDMSVGVDSMQALLRAYSALFWRLADAGLSMESINVPRSIMQPLLMQTELLHSTQSLHLLVAIGSEYLTRPQPFDKPKPPPKQIKQTSKQPSFVAPTHLKRHGKPIRIASREYFFRGKRARVDVFRPICESGDGKLSCEVRSMGLGRMTKKFSGRTPFDAFETAYFALSHVLYKHGNDITWGNMNPGHVGMPIFWPSTPHAYERLDFDWRGELAKMFNHRFLKLVSPALAKAFGR